MDTLFAVWILCGFAGLSVYRFDGHGDGFCSSASCIGHRASHRIPSLRLLARSSLRIPHHTIHRHGADKEEGRDEFNKRSLLLTRGPALAPGSPRAGCLGSAVENKLVI